MTCGVFVLTVYAGCWADVCVVLQEIGNCIVSGATITLSQGSSEASQAAVGAWVTSHRVYVSKLVWRAVNSAGGKFLEVGDSIYASTGLADWQTCTSSTNLGTGNAALICHLPELSSWTAYCAFGISNLEVILSSTDEVALKALS